MGLARQMVTLDGLIQCECGSLIWRVSCDLQFHCELCNKNYTAMIATYEDINAKIDRMIET